MTTRKAYTLKSDVLERKFGKHFERWNGKFHDDRQLFCNIYKMLIEACEVMKTVENLTIQCAFNEYCKRDREVLKEIVERFKKIEENPA